VSLAFGQSHTDSRQNLFPPKFQVEPTLNPVCVQIVQQDCHRIEWTWHNERKFGKKRIEKKIEKEKKLIKNFSECAGVGDVEV